MARDAASFVVVVWNGREYLPACLDALLTEAGPADELLIVDNGSTDGSPELVRLRYPQVRQILNGCNLGFAGGCNVGLRAAAGDLFFLLNQDVVLKPGWAAAMRRALARPDVGVAGSLLRFPDGALQHAGGIIRWPRADVTIRRDGLTGLRDSDYVYGAAWGVRRDVWERIGALDAGFWPGYYEDVDYCLRARRAGLRIVIVADAVALHAESTSLGIGSRSYLHAYHCGRLRLVLKETDVERLADEFAPAERAWLVDRALCAERRVLPAVYRYGLGQLPPLCAEQLSCTPAAFDRAAEALANLALLAGRIVSGGRTMDEEWIDDLAATQVVREWPFRSSVPLVGPLIARFRAVWNSVSTRWYVLPLVQQQNEFNAAVVSHLREIDERLVALDREQTALTRSVAELRYRLIRLDRRLESMGGLLDERD